MALLIAEDRKQLPTGATAPNQLSVPPLGSFQFMVSLPREPQTGPSTPGAASQAQERGVLTEDSTLSLGLQILSLLLHELSIMIIAGISACQLCLPIF